MNAGTVISPLGIAPLSPTLPEPDGPRSRVLIYSHDTFGLGHLRRSLLIAGRSAAMTDVEAVLVATGSPRAQSYALAPGCDTLKLPAVVKTPDGSYRARTLGTSIEDTLRIRAELLSSAARAFHPDVIIVDHAPVGVRGELGPLLEEVQTWRRRPHLLVGLRDIIDDPDRVRAEWDRLDVWRVLRDVYDRVLVYGDPAVLTTAEELNLPGLLGDKLRFVGYLSRPIAPNEGDPRADRTILVTAGGGGDGGAVLEAYAAFLEALPRPASFRSVIVAGPFLEAADRRSIESRLGGTGQPFELHTFTDGLERPLAGAAGVVSMAGYNTVAEILSARRPALLIPREGPRLEQRIRAERLAQRADLSVCRIGPCCPSSISTFVGRVLRTVPVAVPTVRTDGLDRTVDELSAVMSSRAGLDMPEAAHAIA